MFKRNNHHFQSFYFSQEIPNLLKIFNAEEIFQGLSLSSHFPSLFTFTINLKIKKFSKNLFSTLKINQNIQQKRWKFIFREIIRRKQK